MLINLLGLKGLTRVDMVCFSPERFGVYRTVADISSVGTSSEQTEGL